MFIKSPFAPRYSVSFLTPDEVEASPAVLTAWEDLLTKSTNLQRMYQSPEWWKHLCSVRRDSSRLLGIVRDGKDGIVGVVPLQIGRHGLYFKLRKRNLWVTHLKTIFLLGSQPLLPDDAIAYHQLVDSLWQAFPQCNSIYLESVIKESWCWRYFEADDSPRERDYFIYADEGVRPFHSIRVPPTFEEYLKKFSSKRRHEHRREVRVLQKHGGGILQLERIEHPAQIDHFFSTANSLFDKSWKGKCIPTCLAAGKQHFQELARRGILRSYLLKCGDAYCAYLIGYQFQRVFHAIENAHDPAFAKHSPGKVIFLLIIEDLTNFAAPEIANLCYGHLEYKAHLATDHTQDTSLLLVRRTLANRLVCAGHRAYRSTLGALKRCLGRDTPT